MVSDERTLGLDFGGARCGVAITDELGRMAHPRPNLDARNRDRLVEELVNIVHAENIARIVVGLPLEKSGREGHSARLARAFAHRLADATGLAVVLWDERMSSVEAGRALQTSGVNARRAKSLIDGAAAMTILQSYLDAQEGGAERLTS